MTNQSALIEGIDAARISRRTVRGTKALKHYKTNILTHPSASDSEALVELLIDLQLACQKNGVDFQQCLAVTT